MQIITHRTNTAAAFRRSLLAGFGAELDVRDAGGGLVVSHGLPPHDAVKLALFFKIYAEAGAGLPLALNIKSCGLQAKLGALLRRFGVRNYFVFDMAVPDGVGYFKRGLRLFTRQSEYERSPAYYAQAAGVWLDAFERRGPGLSGIGGHLRNRKQVCVVSPELHGRRFLKEWAALKKIQKRAGPGELLLCTDHPGRARRYFDGHD